MANKIEKIVSENKSGIDKFYDHMKGLMGLTDRTIYHYMSYHRHFMDREITQESITKFCTEKKNNNVVRGYMVAYLDFLGRRDEFELPKRRSGTKKKKLPQLLTEEDVKKIIDFGYKTNKKYGLMIELIYYGALRRFEVCTIKINEIRWDSWFDDPSQFCEVKVMGKGRKERIILIPPHAVETIINFMFKTGQLYPTIQPAEVLKVLKSINDPLFLPINERIIYGKVRAYAEKSLNRSIRTHQLRHARATHLEEKGVPIRDIQNYLGHSKLQTTEIYLHATQKQSLKRIRELTKI